MVRKRVGLKKPKTLFGFADGYKIFFKGAFFFKGGEERARAGTGDFLTVGDWVVVSLEMCNGCGCCGNGTVGRKLAGGVLGGSVGGWCGG